MPAPVNRPTPKKTKVSHSVRHDSLSVSATFPDGKRVRVSLSRSGVSASVSVDLPDAQAIARTLIAWVQKVRHEGGSTNGEIFEALALVCEESANVPALLSTLEKI